MAYLNKALLIGNLGKDPEIRVTQSGKKNAKFSLATSEKYKDKTTGEQRDRTEWHNIVAWGVNADNIERLAIKKGMSLYIEGKITYRSWDDPSGQKKNITEIEMERFQILTPKSNTQQSSGDYQQEPQQGAPAPQQGAEELDLPF